MRLKFKRTSWKKNRDIPRGIVHIHSNFSYDGHDSIEKIAGFVKARGNSFVCFTEHDDDFNHEKMEQYVKTCRKASDNYFKVIPGLEFRCKNKVHILGIGIEKYFFADEPVEAAKKIREQGGVSIIAHPQNYINNITGELLDVVDGIEIWNGQKDSRFMPHYRMLNYYKKVKNDHPHIKASCGTDMHSLSSFFELNTVSYSFSGDAKSIWGKSNPEMQGKYFILSTNGDGFFFYVLALAFMRGVFSVVKFFRDFLIKPDGQT